VDVPVGSGAGAAPEKAIARDLVTVQPSEGWPGVGEQASEIKDGNIHPPGLFEVVGFGRGRAMDADADVDAMDGRVRRGFAA
jgi:hypothetical protein